MNYVEISNLTQLRKQKPVRKEDNSNLIDYLYSEDIEKTIINQLSKFNIPIKHWFFDLSFNSLTIKEMIILESILSPKSGVIVKRRFSAGKIYQSNPNVKFLNVEQLIVKTGHYLTKNKNNMIYNPLMVLNNIRKFYSHYQKLIEFEYQIKELSEKRINYFKDALINKYKNSKSNSKTKEVILNKNKEISVNISLEEIIQCINLLVNELSDELYVLSLGEIDRLSANEFVSVRKIGRILNQHIEKYKEGN